MAQSVGKASIAQWKREIVEELLKKFEKYPTIGVLNISEIPAKQFQEIREKLRGRAEIKVSRKTLLKIAIDKAAEEEPELKKLKDCLIGQSSLLFTDMNPFRLWKLLKENSTTAPAKPGMEAPRDIVIPEGDTDFSPGPVVGELQQAGVNARIQAGKVVVLEDSKIVEEGEKIEEEVVGVLSRFGIEPREIGFQLRAAYSEGTFFGEDLLELDIEKTLSNVQDAYLDSLKLSLEINFPTRRNLGMIIGQAHSKAKSLAFSAQIPTKETTPLLLTKAYSQMMGLSSKIRTKNEDALDEELMNKITKSKPSKKPPEKSEEIERKKEEDKKTKEEDKEKEKTDEEESTKAGVGDLF